MGDQDRTTAPRGPAEVRLDEHLELLRLEQPAGDRLLAQRVVHAARWQRAVRAPLQVAVSITGAIVDGLRVLVGARRGSAR